MVANAIIMGTLHVNMEEQLPGASDKMLECLHFLYKSYDNLAANQDTFVWQKARDEFVDNFSKLVSRSHN